MAEIPIQPVRDGVVVASIHIDLEPENLALISIPAPKSLAKLSQ